MEGKSRVCEPFLPMEKMILAIGSTNPVKIEAVKEVIQGYPSLAKAEILSYSVPSGISEQPLSLEETILGAKTRAKNAFEACKSSNYSFGIESGLFAAPGTQTGFLNGSICCIYDGAVYFIGLSCGFEVPPSILQHILHGKMDMSQACCQSGITASATIGEEEGLIGILTNGRMDRKEYTKPCIITALIQLEHSRWY